MRNEKGFTLVEMMIVMLVISVLLIVTIPNVAKHNENINEKGCQAYVKMVEAQVQSYGIKHNRIPTLAELKSGGYLSGDGCPDGKTVVQIDADGNVTTTSKTSTSE